MITALFRDNLWKLGTVAAGCISLSLAGMLAVSYLQNQEIDRQRQALQLQITDPKTGYVARLTQATANVAKLQDELKVQNERYSTLARESEIKLTYTKRELAAAKAQTLAMEKQIEGFLAVKPRGDTLEDRVNDIDERAMREFVR